MISFALDSNNDIIVRDGNFVLVRDGAQVVQAVRSRLLAYRGEWFLDTNSGVPYFQDILTKPVDLGKVESIIKSTILNTVGVKAILTFSTTYDRNSRTLSLSADLETIYGEVNINEVTVNA